MADRRLADGDLSPRRAAPIVLAHAASFEIGALKVVPAKREVIGPNSREVIEPRVMQVLVALYRASPELLSRDDLVESCWDGLIVGDDAITRVISRLRKLGEVMGGAFQIETVTKVGYRLVVEGREEAGASAEPAAPTADKRMARAFSRRDWMIGLGAAAAIGSGGALLWRARPQPALSPRAQQLIDRAMTLLRAGRGENVSEAINLLRQAVAEAPDSAETWGHLALALAISRSSQPSSEGDRRIAEARQAAARALELDPTNAPARLARIWDMAIYGEWLSLETAARDVLSSAPDNPYAHMVVSSILIDTGRLREALSFVTPFDADAYMVPSAQWNIAMSLWALGRGEEADAVMNRAMERWPRTISVWFPRYYLWARSGQPQRALDMSARRDERPLGVPPEDFDLVDLGTRALMTRAPADIEAAMTRSMEAARAGSGYAINTMLLASQLGRLDEAFAVAAAYFFGRGFQVGNRPFSEQQGGYVAPYQRWTRHLWWPCTAPMRSDPRFRPMLEEMGLASYWRRSASRPDFPV